jgi:hypothetical protein
MIKKTVFVAFVLNVFIGYSQDIVSTIPVKLKNNRDVFQIINDSTKQVTLFLSDRKTVNAIRLDEKMQFLDSIVTNRPDKYYSEMIGYISKGSKQNLFWSSGDSKEILVQNFDFEKRTILSKNFTLEFKKEVVLQKFSLNKKFYILSVLKTSNSLKLYMFDQNSIMTEKIIDLNLFKFFDSRYVKTDIYGMFRESFLPSEGSFSLQKISPESPTSLTYSSKKRKCYLRDNSLVVTLDTNKDYTQIIIINTNDYSASEKIIKKPLIVSQQTNIPNSNSFLFGEKLYQVKNNSDVMIVSIKNLNGDDINEYKIFNDKPIEFKNSDIIQFGGDFSSKRILDKSNQFLRKTANLNTGISCYNIKGNNLITLGSVSEQTNNNAMFGAMFGLTGALIAAAISPTYDNFNSYSNRRVVYFNSLLDNNDKHIKGIVQPLAFDKIQIFSQRATEITSQGIFKIEENYYFSYYDSKESKYIIRKFTD